MEHAHEKTSRADSKGLILVGSSLLLLLALLSFTDGNMQTNYLGLLGHVFAFAMHFLFGLCSYAVALFIGYLGVERLRGKFPGWFGSKTLYFSLFVLSMCVILNLLAERGTLDIPALKDHIYSQMATIDSPIPQKITRYNYGGAPAYFILHDAKHFNLELILSQVGVFLTFGILGITSFFLFTEIDVVWLFRSFLRLCRLIFKGARATTESSFEWIKNASPALDLIKRKPLEISLDSEPEPLFRPYEALPPQEAMEEIEEVEVEKVKPQKRSIHVNKQEVLPKKPKVDKLQNPPITLLTDAKTIDQPSLKKELRKQAEVLEETLSSFGIEARVGEINCGPTITSFEVHPSVGVKVQKIKTLENDIALNLEAKSIRIIAPIPGKAAVGVEIPSLYPQEVGFKEMLYNYRRGKQKYQIPIMLGKTVSGEDVTTDLTKMPHCIIAGATGSGKSVCINTMIMSMLMSCHPDEVKLILVDPKKVELTPFANLPHLIAPVITEAKGAYAALHWLVKEMQERYEVLKQLGHRNISAFNSRKLNFELESSLSIEVPEKMPFIVAIIDEFADLMMSTSVDLETPIARIAQMARAVGIHLILATQRPSREVITGIIKANFPSRIAFKVSSRVNSQIILDENGAETLLGNGDMLFLPPGSSQLLRSQGVFVRDEDIREVVDHLILKYGTNYLLKSFDEMSSTEFLPGADTAEESAGDELYERAKEIVISTRTASTTFIQRKLKIGYARAASLIDALEENGIVGPAEGSKPRKVLS